MSAPNLRSQSGQLIVEAVLIIVLLVAITGMTIRMFKETEVFRQLVTGPWVSLAGMLQNGVWAPPKTGAAIHPNAHRRHIVISGEEAR